ncbi:hypothetical protein ACFQZS_16210 [Mucilaginibacter calamicampi]|uniref:Uncharacterized protein n=1 Tax=Mucilaginibacter calamicampi TaxID=1302352 RepID=A0ABW2Z4K3_9SPHI
MARRKFKKVFLICENNKIFGDYNYQMVNMYRERKHAESVCKSQNQLAVGEAQKLYNKSQTITQGTVHAYYLVHESYFDEKENK